MKNFGIVLSSFVFVGCISMGITGRPIRPDPLSQMQPGISSQEQVMVLIGEPSGVGSSRLGPDVPQQEIWFYHHMAFEIPAKMEMLLVFFEEGRYNGHFWFSSFHGIFN